MRQRKPKYRRHTTRDLGFVEHDGRRHYFAGAYGSLESLGAYAQFLKDHGFLIQELGGKPACPSLAVLCDRFIRWAEATYAFGRHSRLGNLRNVTKRLGEFTGPHARMDDFTPLKFKEFQQWSITKGRSRRYINDLTADIKFIFKWAVSEELMPVLAYQALLTVPGLRRGRSGAKDRPPRKPVPAAHVEATLPGLSKTVRAMVQFQAVTGVRSQSVCYATPSQFDRSGKLWVWKPRHKMENAGHVLTVFVGKRGQKIIKPFLAGKSPDDYVFQPRNKKGNRSRRYRSFYDVGSYRMAIRRAAKKAGVPHWFPHQLRHTLGTVVREKHGLEAAQAVLGHIRIDATQIYAQKQIALAKMVAEAMG